MLAGATALVAGCTSDQPTELAGVQQIAYITRTPSDTGNVFDYTRDPAPTDQSDIILLSPPSASGTKTNLTKLPAGSDVMAMDLSFDAAEIAFSARIGGGDHYHIYRINVDGTNPCQPGAMGYCQVTDGPYDEVYPVFLPGGRIFFMTNQNVEGAMVKQFQDEYERARTAQVATMTRAGGDIQLGARNVSHRVAPTLSSDGRILFTQWDHLSEKNEGNLMFLQQDMTGNREAFGKECDSAPMGVTRCVANAYLRPREIQPGQFVAIATSRDRTFQAGKIAVLNLGDVNTDGTINVAQMAEAHSSASDLTPDVPADRTPSFDGVGRYYDAFPIGDPKLERFLVTWSDGPVESMELGKAGKMPSFGIYLYDAVGKTRMPIAVDSASWLSSPIPIAKRAEPSMLNSQSNMAMGTQSTLISAINVYDSTIQPQLTAGSVKKIRLMEGFSDEEGIPGDFGLTEADGHALLGEIDPGGDGSFKAVVPANTPIHIQLVDQFGMSLKTEPVWIQGRGGEARVCGGCHEDRTKTPQIAPGSSALQAVGAAALDLPRPMRTSTTYTPDKVRGIPWDKALQPIFDAHCVDCHDGTAGPANPSYTVQDLTDMITFSFTFNLKGDPVKVTVGDMMYSYSASHVALLGPSMMFREKTLTFVGGVMPPVYVEPGSAATSQVIKMVNPPLRYPHVDMNTRAFPGPAHPAEVGVYNTKFNGADAKYQLNADEYYLLELMADMGGQYYSRENAPGGTY